MSVTFGGINYVSEIRNNILNGYHVRNHDPCFGRHGIGTASRQ